MNIVTAESLALHFGEKDILRGEGFAIARGDRIGLIGANGTGKTSLLRLLCGQQNLDGGAFHFAKNVTVGYLPQDVLEMPQGVLLQSVLNAAPGKADLDGKFYEVEKELGEATTPKLQEELAVVFAELDDQKELFESTYSPFEAEKILLGLGFKEVDFKRPLSELSGGWKMRAALAGLLFSKPTLLLMDEPTNHLDVPTVLWLDEFLQAWPKAMVLVSHDRDFLNNQIKRLLSFEFEGLRAYTGNYNQYLKQREDEERLLLARAKNIEDRKRQAMRFVTRFRAKNTKAKQVKSKLKEIERLGEIDLPAKRRTLTFSFPPASRSGKDVIRIGNLCKSFPGVPLFENLDKSVYRGNRIAIIGVNGAGKSTLLKMVAGEEKQDSGILKIGHNVSIGYYAQHHVETLDIKKTLLDQVWGVVPDATQSFVRGVCGAFLFSGDDVEKPIGVLSGGEKARVLLSCLLVKPGNLLLMDEPTNHLDLWSSEALADALETYDGTLIFVSHNKAFVNRLANIIWDVDQGRIYEFPGSLDEYLYH